MILNPVITYIIQETMKQQLKGKTNMILVYLLSGAVSKALATLITYPLFVLRTMRQCEKKSY